MLRVIATAWLIAVALAAGSPAAQAQYWQRMPSGYRGWGAYREWPRGWYGVAPGYRYYGPNAFVPFSYWRRNPRYLY